MRTNKPDGIGGKKRGPRFVKAFTRILRDHRLKPVDKCVLWCIKSYADADGYCIPSVDRISADLNIGKVTIHKAMKKLRTMGVMNWPRGWTVQQVINEPSKV